MRTRKILILETRALVWLCLSHANPVCVFLVLRRLGVHLQNFLCSFSLFLE